MNVRRYVAARRDGPNGPEVMIKTRPVSWLDWARVCRTARKFWLTDLSGYGGGRMDWATAWAVAKGICDVEEGR